MGLLQYNIFSSGYDFLKVLVYFFSMSLILIYVNRIVILNNMGGRKLRNVGVLFDISKKLRALSVRLSSVQFLQEAKENFVFPDEI